METFLQEKKETKSGVSKVLVGAILVAAALVAGAIWLLTFQPTREQQQQLQLAGAYLEGSPEFEAYTNNLIITTDLNRTTESPLGLGTIQMMIHGNVRNKGNRNINGLEVKVGVVNTKNQVIKEKKIMLVPNQVASLSEGETIHVFVPIDGFAKDDDRANVRWKVTAIRFE